MASEAAFAENAPHSAHRARLMTTVPWTSAALQLVASLLWVPQAALIALTIGNVANGHSSDSSAWAAFGVLAIGILRATLDSLGSRLAFRVGRSVASQLRQQAVAALAERSPLDIDRPEAGKAASVIAEQAEMIVPYVARFEIAKLRAVVVPIALFSVVLWFSWAAAVVLLLAAPLIPIFMALIGWRAQEASEAQLAKTGDINAFLLDRLRGITTIRALGAVDATARRLRANAEDLRTRTMTVLRIAFLSSAVLELFAALGVAMVAVYVGFYLLGQQTFGTWDSHLGLGEGLFILLLAPAFFEPLRDLSAVWHDRASGRAALDGLSRLAASNHTMPGTASSSASVTENHSRAPAIQIEKLSFKYREGEPLVFDRFDLAISPGEHVALLGPSGTGKSTLLALVAGLARPTEGAISIDGHDITDENVAALRSDMAWIGQRPHIFAGTLAKNVALGRKINSRQIAEALKAAKLDALSEARNARAIGENGFGLSGGEALRLAVARIAARPNARILLADEPTAHLDAETAKDVADGLIALGHGKTMIVATHDLTLARRMNRIVRLGVRPLERAA